MDKLQYDSFYKFIVSVGVILIVAPLFCLHYLVSGSYDIIISQDEANNLSQISSDFLSIKIQYIQAVFQFLPIICTVFLVFGILLILWGGFKWLHIQKKLDKITSLDLEEKNFTFKICPHKKLQKKSYKKILRIIKQGTLILKRTIPIQQLLPEFTKPLK